ncbi:MAG: hypothetical protein ACYCPS_04245 [Candidatus Saccharimonadales bacterium]
MAGKQKSSFISSLVKKLQKSSQSRLTAMFVVVGFALGCLVLYYGVDAYYHTFRTFVAYQDNFKVHFPGKPTVSNLPHNDSPPGTISSSRSYEYSSNSNNYIVDATDYLNLNSVKLSKTNLNALLKGSVNISARSLSGSVKDIKTMSFLGLSAKEADILSKSNHSYSLTFIKKHTLYTLTSTGLSQAQFNKFVSSFHFLFN